MTDAVSLAELFARDPRKHTDADIIRIVTELRAARSKFVIGGDKTAGSLTAQQKQLSRLDLGIKL